jgi:hypothetical protein
MRDEALEGFMHRDAARTALRERLAPAGLLGRKLEHPDMALYPLLAGVIDAGLRQRES